MNVQALLALLVAAPPCVWAACPPGTFECGIRCIAEEYVCDGLRDCNEAADEKQDACKGKCKPGATFCSKLGRCIQDWMPCDKARVGFLDYVDMDCRLNVYLQNRARADCNGYYECTDDRDERDCGSPERCAPTAFFCNSTCSPRSRLCDGVRTCINVDDEANCTYGNTTPTESTTATEAPTSAARTETTTSIARTEPPISTAMTEAPTSTAGTEAPASTARTEAPTSTAGTEAPTSTAGTEAPTSTAMTEAPTSTRMGNTTDTPATHGPVHIHGDVHLHFHVNAGVRTGPGGGAPLLLVLVFLLL